MDQDFGLLQTGSNGRANLNAVARNSMTPCNKKGAEMLRLESNRLQKRWDKFVLNNEKRLKNFEVESEQMWATANRHERGIREQLTLMEGSLLTLEQEKDLLWRVQNAQSDALKTVSPAYGQTRCKRRLIKTPIVVVSPL